MKNGFWQKMLTFISLVLAVGGVVAAHFKGISTAKGYTDQKVQEVEKEFIHRFERLEDKQDRILEILKR